jgi:hypothetical protein
MTDNTPALPDRYDGHKRWCQSFMASPETGKLYPCNCGKSNTPALPVTEAGRALLDKLKDDFGEAADGMDFWHEAMRVEYAENILAIEAEAAAAVNSAWKQVNRTRAAQPATLTVEALAEALLSSFVFDPNHPTAKKNATDAARDIIAALPAQPAEAAQARDGEVARLREALLGVAGNDGDPPCWCDWFDGEHERRCRSARALIEKT